MIEVAAGVFVGNPSARVRDALWPVLSQRIGDGRAVVIEPAADEQGRTVRTAGTDRGYPVDYDGPILFARNRVLNLQVSKCRPRTRGGPPTILWRHMRQGQSSPLGACRHGSADATRTTFDATATLWIDPR